MRQNRSTPATANTELRLAELIMALSLATDLGMGMPMEWAMSYCLLAVRLGEALGLSERELEVLHELAAGHSNKEIAAHLHVSPNTIKTHVARLFEKLGARRRTEAILRARELGILP